MSSVDGNAELSWSLGQSEEDLFFRVTETSAQGEAAFYHDSSQLKLFRAESDNYRFVVQACQASVNGPVQCGKKSKTIRLDVNLTEEEFNTSRMDDMGSAFATSDSGPAGLKPGLWRNPNREGYGWSLYWNNRNASNANWQPGASIYDLVGYWFTYEATVRYLDGGPDCGEGQGGSGCYMVFENYKPVAARLKLIDVSGDGNEYVGGIYITRQGQERQVGNITIQLGESRFQAGMHWTTSFALQQLSASETIEYLGGETDYDDKGIGHLAGTWESMSASSVVVVNDISRLSEAVEVIFEDGAGNPAWAQAVSIGKPSADGTNLCFLYVNQGFQPGTPSSPLGVTHLGCDPGLPASSTNRNGWRAFDDVQQQRFWADFELPAAPSGNLKVGSVQQPFLLQKTSNFHRIEWFINSNECDPSDISSDCGLGLRWFTDGDFPEASVFLLDVASGQRQRLKSNVLPVVDDYDVLLPPLSELVFELRMGGSSESTLIAASSPFHRTGQVLPPPTALAVSWLSEPDRTYRVSWSHDGETSGLFFELSELMPGQGAPVVHSVLDGDKSFNFTRVSGPFGEYTYRVRACLELDTHEQCSDWSPAENWEVTPPPGDDLNPWQEIANSDISFSTGLGYRYALGYRFESDTDGYVTGLGGFFQGDKWVRLFRHADRALLAEARVSSDDDWSYEPIDPVEINAGQVYTVAVYINGQGGTRSSSLQLPLSTQEITILSAAYASTSDNSAAYPSYSTFGRMYGQADISFSTTLGPENSAPILSLPESPVPGKEGQYFSLQLQASDTDNDALSFQIEGLPDGLSLNEGNGLISGVPAAGTAEGSPWQLTVRVSDTGGASDQGEISIVVEAAATNPANPETPPNPAPKPAYDPGESAKPVGAVSADFSVDSMGSANYVIPIPTAPASGGFAPQLTLQYSSSGGNDVAGVGWSVGGISSITRCAKTFEQDGVFDSAIYLDDRDRFCLDGQRLMAVSGEYGESGTEYRTEIDGLVKVKSKGRAGAGPEYFEVYYGDGSHSLYGVTEDSGFRAPGSLNPDTRLLWALSNQRDESKNYIEFVYQPTGEVIAPLALSRVRYTGNYLAKTLPYAELRFTYEPRPDQEVSYVAGVRIERIERLQRIDSVSKIKSSSGSFQSLRSLFLEYTQDGYGRSALSGITACSEPSQATCFDKTTFEWSKTEHEIGDVQQEIGVSFGNDFRALTLADINGDARPDLLKTHGSNDSFRVDLHTALQDGGFSDSTQSFTIPDGGVDHLPVNLTVMDLNSDGYEDVLYPKRSGEKVNWVARLSNGSALGAEEVVVQGCCNLLRPPLLRVMDFNGDARPDLLTSRATAWGEPAREMVVLLNAYRPGKAVGFEPARAITLQFDSELLPSNGLTDGWYQDESLLDVRPMAGSGHFAARPLDYNGDGKPDLLLRLSRNYVRCVRGCSSQEAIVPAEIKPLHSATLRFSSDDPILAEASSGALSNRFESATASFYVVLLSDGDTSFSQAAVVAIGAGTECSLEQLCSNPAGLPEAQRVRPVDINADGLMDLAFQDGLYDWSYGLNNGSELIQFPTFATPPNDARSNLGQFLDLNGDGYPEFIYPDHLSSDEARWTVNYNDLGRGFAAEMLSSMRTGNLENNDFNVFSDFNADGMLDLLLVRFQQGVIDEAESGIALGQNLINSANATPRNLLTGSKDGFGVITSLTYDLLTNPDVYTRGNGAHLVNQGRGSAVLDYIAPQAVVAQSAKSSPTFDNEHAQRMTSYKYSGARLQVGGRGFLGFRQVSRWDSGLNLRENNVYHQAFPLSGQLEQSLTVHDSMRLGARIYDESALGQIDGTLERTEHQWKSVESIEDTGAWLVLQELSEQRKYTLGGNISSRVKESYLHDGYGRIIRSVRATHANEGSSFELQVATVNAYAPVDDARWRIDNLVRSENHHSRPGQPTQVRTVAYGYDSFGRRNEAVMEPDRADYTVVTNHELDVYGNIKESVISAADLDPRIGYSDYDSWGRFIVKERNHYGQVQNELLVWDQFGNRLREKDINGAVTEREANAMGQIRLEWHESGQWTRSEAQIGRYGACGLETGHGLITISGGKPAEIRCFDSLGREIRRLTTAFDGGWNEQSWGFDTAGRAVRISEPTRLGDPFQWTLYEFDALGRPENVQYASGDVTRYRYDESVSSNCSDARPRSINITNGLGQDRFEYRNVMGELVETHDDHCGQVLFEYDAMGNLLSQITPGGAQSLMSYDEAGRKTAISDPDKGQWQYSWNALGELKRQLNAERQAIDFEYDALGRVVRREELTAVDHLADTSVSRVNHEITRWNNSISSSVSGKGQQNEVIYYDSLGGNVLNSVSDSYDRFGRLIQRDTVIGGESFTEEFTFDEFSRPFQVFDPSGDYRGIRYLYNTAGYVSKLIESREGLNGVLYQEIIAMNARGNITGMRLGNGVETYAAYEQASGRLKTLQAWDKKGIEIQELRYAYDVLGNLQRLADSTGTRDHFETYDYDSLNRLSGVELTKSGTTTRTLEMQYDVSGNITWKSDVGAYGYARSGGHSNAVTRAGGEEYSYDKNGNQVTGSGRVITYGVAEQAVHIQRAGQQTSFEYGVGGQRVARTDNNSVDGEKHTLYLGSAHLISSASGTFFRRYIGGIASVDYFPSTGAQRTRYFLRDRLGSIHSIIGEDGLAKSATWLSFDAFGNRRATDWSSPVVLGDLVDIGTLSSQSYTGHEQVDAMGIIHMNGRIYDPKLARFLQADVYQQSPDDTQAVNRYSYASNNPFMATDPSGYFFKRFVKRWGRLIAALAIGVILPGTSGLLATQFTITNAYAQAFITGFVAGAIVSGTLKGAVIGAITAVAVQGIVHAFSSQSAQAKKLAKPSKLEPSAQDISRLVGSNQPASGLYRIHVDSNGLPLTMEQIGVAQIGSGETIFSNGMKNGFADAVRNGTTHVNNAGLLSDSYILNFNPTQGFARDLGEAAKDVWGAHTGLSHSQLAKNLAGTINQLSERGVTGLNLIGHSQGGAITASALRYGAKSGINLSSLSGGSVAFHGAPVNTRIANSRFGGQGFGVVHRAQFGDAVHVLGGLNFSNPLELPVSIYRSPTLFSSDPSLSPHALPCAGGRSALCLP